MILDYLKLKENKLKLNIIKQIKIWLSMINNLKVYILVFQQLFKLILKENKFYWKRIKWVIKNGKVFLFINFEW
jgi:hypothetical protein